MATIPELRKELEQIKQTISLTQNDLPRVYYRDSDMSDEAWDKLVEETPNDWHVEFVSPQDNPDSFIAKLLNKEQEVGSSSRK
jgi:hypothetical protein